MTFQFDFEKELINHKEVQKEIIQKSYNSQEKSRKCMEILSNLC